jgi:protein gp37
MRVSPACDRCYAAAIAKRFGWRDNEGRELWDVHAERKRTSEAYWRGPLRWNRDALATGERRRVFCASMADIFDNHAPEAWRVDLWDLIRATPALIWVLLSKRPQTAPAMFPPDWGDGWPNVWLGKLHWVICGGESGAEARPTQPDWVRNLRDQVHAAGVKLFVKQLGSNRTAWPSIKRPRGENPAEWPENHSRCDKSPWGKGGGVAGSRVR